MYLAANLHDLGTAQISTGDSANSLRRKEEDKMHTAYIYLHRFVHAHPKLSIAWAVITIILVTVFALLDAYGKGRWWDANSVKFLFGDDRWANFCEEIILENFFRQRSDAWSNIIFIICGYSIIFIFIYVKREKSIDINSNDVTSKFDQIHVMVKNYPIWIFWFGFHEIYIGFASFTFHASYKMIPAAHDMISVYCFMVFLTCFIAFQFYYSFVIKSMVDKLVLNDIDRSDDYNRDRFDEVNTKANKKLNVVCICLLAFSCGLNLFQAIYGVDNDIFDSIEWDLVYLIMGIGIFLLIIEHVWYYIFGQFQVLNKNLMIKTMVIGWFGIILLFASFFFRSVDEMDGFCDPNAIYQWHAMWHVFLGFGLFILFLCFFKQELKPMDQLIQDHATISESKEKTKHVPMLEMQQAS